jgi:hypothetical protein
VFLSSAHGQKRPLAAIRQGATGDITPADDSKPGEYIAWYLPRDGIYMQTPIVYGDYLYACLDNGLLTCYEARTGKQIYRKRLGKGATGFTASAVAGDGKLYFTSENGEIYVVKAGSTFELLATNAMNEVCMATPAISDGSLIVRTENHVYCIDAKSEPGRTRQVQSSCGTIKFSGRCQSFCGCPQAKRARTTFRIGRHSIGIEQTSALPLKYRQ